MDKKYWVPALEKADAVLEMIAGHPGKCKLIDLSRQLGIHKSSMFSLLHTLEALGWVEREPGDTYLLGTKLARYGSSLLRQYELVERFQACGAKTMRLIGETVQLARLEGRSVLYLGKLEAPSPVRLASDPGMRFPANETALGKVMLAELSTAEVKTLYPEFEFPQTTPYTIRTREEFIRQLGKVKADGTALDEQESVMGFCCVAAPVWNEDGRAEAAVSISIPLHRWETKQEQAKQEIKRLAAALSMSVPSTKTKGGEGQ